MWEKGEIQDKIALLVRLCRRLLRLPLGRMQPLLFLSRSLFLSLWPSLLPSPFPSSFPPRLAARASFYLYVNLSLSLPLSALLTSKRCLNANQEGEGGDVCQPVGSQCGVSERLQLCLSLVLFLSLSHTLTDEHVYNMLVLSLLQQPCLFVAKIELLQDTAV